MTSPVQSREGEGSRRGTRTRSLLRCEGFVGFELRVKEWGCNYQNQKYQN